MQLLGGLTKPKVATIGDVRLVLDPEVMSERMLEVISKGSYEQAEARQIGKIVQDGERIVELGAGVGFISILAARTGKAKAITAYEANPALIPIIEQNYRLNDVKVHVENKVVMRAPPAPSVPFYLRHDFWASSLSPQPWGFREKVEVRTESFVEMLKKHQPTMLIIDIEGGELDLMDEIPLTGIKKIYLELHQKVIGRVGMKRVFDFLSSRDFHYDQHHSEGSVVLFSHVLR